MTDLLHDKLKILITLDRERSRPFPSPTVIQACELALRQIASDPRLHSTFADLSEPNDD